eukprot:3452114-Alexandrium_andersonii.AAC.1
MVAFDLRTLWWQRAEVITSCLDRTCVDPGCCVVCDSGPTSDVERVCVCCRVTQGGRITSLHSDCTS